MESPPSSECAATVRCDDDRGSVHNGLRVDGKWYHHRVCEGTCRCRSYGACMFFNQCPHFRLSLTITRLL